MFLAPLCFFARCFFATPSSSSGHLSFFPRPPRRLGQAPALHLLGYPISNNLTCCSFTLIHSHFPSSHHIVAWHAWARKKEQKPWSLISFFGSLALCLWLHLHTLHYETMFRGKVVKLKVKGQSGQHLLLSLKNKKNYKLLPMKIRSAVSEEMLVKATKYDFMYMM